MSFSTIVTFDSSTQVTYDTTLVEVAGGLIRLKDLGGATYSTANPAITSQNALMASSLTSFAHSASIAGSDNVKYQVGIGGTYYYYDTGTTLWTLAGTTGYTATNTATELNSNFSTLFSSLSLSGNLYITLKIYLHSDSGSTRPSLTSNTIGYGFTDTTPATINQCVVSAYLKDLQAGAPTYSALTPSKLVVKNDRAFLHGNTLIQPFAKSATFDSTGLASLSVIETTTPGEFLDFYVSYFEGRSLKSVKLVSAIVPNQGTANLSAVTTVRDADFG